MVARNAADTAYDATTDRLGSIRGWFNTVTDSVMGAQLFTPYGTRVAIDSAPAYTLPSYGWTGREYDAETGFYYLRARYYDPFEDRFVQEDPAGYSGGSNVYAYVGGAVLSATDPSGMLPTPDGAFKMDGYIYAGDPAVYAQDDIDPCMFGGCLLPLNQPPQLIVAPQTSVCIEGVGCVAKDDGLAYEQTRPRPDAIAALTQFMHDFALSLGLGYVGNLLGGAEEGQAVRQDMADLAEARELASVTADGAAVSFADLTVSEEVENKAVMDPFHRVPSLVMSQAYETGQQTTYTNGYRLYTLLGSRPNPNSFGMWYDGQYEVGVMRDQITHAFFRPGP